MATHGLRTVTVTNWNTLEFAWERTAVSVENNTSTIHWQMTLIAGTYGTIRSSVNKTWQVNVNGNTYSGVNTVGITSNSTKVLCEGTTVIPHGQDGQKIFSYSFSQQFDIDWGDAEYIGTKGGSGTGTLDGISRGATITWAPDFTDLDNPTITYTNPNGSNVSSIQACIADINGREIFVPYRNINPIAPSYTFELTTTERNNLINATVGSNKLSVRFYIKVVINGSTLYNSVLRTFTISDNSFSIAPTVEDINPTTLALTGDKNILVKGKSRAECNFHSTTSAGATVVSYLLIANMDTSSPNDTSGSRIQADEICTFSDIRTGNFKFAATDSRNNHRSAVIVKGLVDYSAPTLTWKVTEKPVSVTGTLKIAVSGNWFNGSFGAANNTLSLQYRYAQGPNKTYSNWITAIPVLNGNAYTSTIIISPVDYQLMQYVQIRVRDVFDDVSVTTEAVVSTMPIFDWSESDFNFNVPVTMQGEPINDFVIETGTEAMGSNGTWYWRKWHSGRSECCGLRNYGNTAVSTAWGGLYRSEIFTQSLPSGLFISSPESISINLMYGGYGGWIAMHEDSPPTASQTGSFIIVRPASANITAARIGFNCVGRWKQ